MPDPYGRPPRRAGSPWRILVHQWLGRRGGTLYGRQFDVSNDPSAPGRGAARMRRLNALRTGLRHAGLTNCQACMTLDSMIDPRIIAILDAYLDPEAAFPAAVSHYLLWGIFCSYNEHVLADGTGLKMRIPEGAPSSGVTPLEAMAAATALIGQLQGTCQWMTAEARKRGASWADIGGALGMSRQAAWERFRNYADDPAWEPWERMREEYRALAGDSADS